MCSPDARPEHSDALAWRALLSVHFGARCPVRTRPRVYRTLALPALHALRVDHVGLAAVARGLGLAGRSRAGCQSPCALLRARGIAGLRPSAAASAGQRDTGQPFDAWLGRRRELAAGTDLVDGRCRQRRSLAGGASARRPEPDHAQCTPGRARRAPRSARRACAGAPACVRRPVAPRTPDARSRSRARAQRLASRRSAPPCAEGCSRPRAAALSRTRRRAFS
jgi:hypothetical protein